MLNRPGDASRLGLGGEVNDSTLAQTYAID